METNPPVANPVMPEKWLRNYLPMWIGQAVSLLGSALVQFALVWYLTEKTGSAGVLATATFVALIPGVLIGPFAGALVDRWNRKRTMIFSDLGVTLATLGLVALFAGGWIETWHIYVVLFIRSLSGTFQGPAMSASTSLMVPKEHFSRLSGINQALYGVINIVSPPAGALLLEVLPMQGVLAVDIVTAALAIALLLFLVTVPQPARDDQASATTPMQILADVRTGLRYVAGWPGILMLMISASLINMLATPAFTLLPLLVTKHFGLGARELAWTDSAFGIGVVAGGLLLGVWGGFRRKISTSLAGILGMGVGIIFLGLVNQQAFWTALIFLGLVGLTNALANGPLGALMQTLIPPEMQGRIFTITGSLSTAAAPIGMLFAAPIADRLGIQAWYLVAGAMCLLIGVFGFLNRHVATLDDQLPGGRLKTDAEQTSAQPLS